MRAIYKPADARRIKRNRIGHGWLHCIGWMSSRHRRDGNCQRIELSRSPLCALTTSPRHAMHKLTDAQPPAGAHDFIKIRSLLFSWLIRASVPEISAGRSAISTNFIASGAARIHNTCHHIAVTNRTVPAASDNAGRGVNIHGCFSTSAASQNKAAHV